MDRPDLPDVLGLTTDEAIRRLQAAGAVCKVRYTESKKSVADPDDSRVLRVTFDGGCALVVSAKVRIKPYCKENNIT